jgi:hypothetical protein
VVTTLLRGDHVALDEIVYDLDHHPLGEFYSKPLPQQQQRELPKVNDTETHTNHRLLPCCSGHRVIAPPGGGGQALAHP